MSYSETLMEHFGSPRNNGPMPDADRMGRAGTPGRGPFLILYLKLDGPRVSAARYQSHGGCGATVAAGSVLTELVTDRPVDDCLKLTPDDLIDALDGVPPTKLHAPALAIAALRDALK